MVVVGAGGAGARGRAHAGTVYVVPGVPLLPHFSIVRRRVRGRGADGRVCDRPGGSWRSVEGLLTHTIVTYTWLGRVDQLVP